MDIDAVSPAVCRNHHSIRIVAIGSDQVGLHSQFYVVADDVMHHSANTGNDIRRMIVMRSDRDPRSSVYVNIACADTDNIVLFLQNISLSRNIALILQGRNMHRNRASGNIQKPCYLALLN